MLEAYIQRLKDEGKISEEELNQKIEENRLSLPPTQATIESLKKRQEETENVLMALLLGGM